MDRRRARAAASSSAAVCQPLAAERAEQAVLRRLFGKMEGLRVKLRGEFLDLRCSHEMAAGSEALPGLKIIQIKQQPLASFAVGAGALQMFIGSALISEGSIIAPYRAVAQFHYNRLDE